MKETVMRYIIIGYGNIGRKRHKILKEKCVSIIDPIFSSADYKDYRNVPLDIFDAAIISTPNQCKIDILKYLISKKKHILVEKPMLFDNVDKAEELYKMAQLNCVIWYTSYNHRFEPLINKFRDLLLDGAIGDLYFANFVYGNGTAQNIIGSWRDNGLGVLEDLGCHLLDLSSYFFSPRDQRYKMIAVEKFETRVMDYCAFSTIDGKMQFICSTVMWKNSFKIDVFGSRGSLHLDGLQKWGESRLICRERVLPSGVPIETICTASGEDNSWERDLDHFEQNIKTTVSSFENDMRISQAIHSLAKYD
jgi:predicted dehydrogenase